MEKKNKYLKWFKLLKFIAVFILVFIFFHFLWILTRNPYYSYYGWTHLFYSSEGGDNLLSILVLFILALLVSWFYNRFIKESK